MRPWDVTPGEIPAGDSLAACLAAVLELRPGRLPPLPDAAADPSAVAVVSRLVGSLGVGLVPVADPPSFSWPGPWIARIEPLEGAPRFVVMFGVPSGVVWDPAGDGTPPDQPRITHGYVVAAGDIALARPPVPDAPAATGRVEAIWVAASAGEPARAQQVVRALPGRGLDGDRHVTGTGTFPSGLPGSALTLVEAEVCETFDPPLAPDVHRRNVVTRGIPLNDLVGHEFTIGDVRCRGMRLCEPCTVVQRYAGRPVLRDLVHRGGLRTDILSAGEIRVGDEIRAAAAGPG